MPGYYLYRNIDRTTIPLGETSFNKFYPEEPIQISKQEKIRGIDVVMLGITPFHYNPVTKQLIVYRD